MNRLAQQASRTVLRRRNGLPLPSSSTRANALPLPLSSSSRSFHRQLRPQSQSSHPQSQAGRPRLERDAFPHGTAFVFRRYNSNSSSGHSPIASTFATSLHQFLMTIGQIARIITFTGATIGILIVIAFEGGHQYVEHVLMKNFPPGLLTSSSKDTWGWDEEETEESWGSRTGGGTDSRLGLYGRHALRSAFVTMTIGGGVSTPLQWGRAGGGGPSGMNVKGRKKDPEEENGREGLPMESDGLALSEQFLSAAVVAAEKKGIKLPDLAAYRAGVLSSQAAGLDKPLDGTAVALETRLASARERLGPEYTPMAIAGYERIYDALQAQSTAGPTVDASRLVRLARKIGDLNVSMGNRDEGKRWLLKGIELAGGKGGQEGEEAATASTAGAIASTPVPVPVPAPTPALTRSLVSTLVSMSGFYASRPSNGAGSSGADWKSSLEEALRVQASTLRLIRTELERTSTQSSDTKSTSSRANNHGKQLHTLWLLHQESCISIHLAETIYALGRTNSSSSKNLLKSLFGGGSESNSKSLKWLQEASDHSLSIRNQLSLDGDKLSAHWESAQQSVRLPAQRLWRDSNRVKIEVDRMLAALNQEN
ncbi:unnamed protein product [Sympodiomycopsis kandeliae]